MKVLLHCAAGDALKRRLHDLMVQELDVTVCPENDETRFVGLLGDTEVLWHVLTPVTAEHMAAAPNLRLIQKIGVGVNTIDLEAARARGIHVSNMPGTNSRAVAEMTLALMLSALRRLSYLDLAARRGEWWSRITELQGNLGEIHGRTVGLIGYGGVPRRLAPILKAMGARVLYTAQSRKDDAEAEWRTLDDLLAQSDIVSLHVPFTAETGGMIGRNAIARMKPGAILVNTARGELVDEVALLDALRSGHLRAAGLDVFASEPVDPANSLLSLENVVVAPHLAWLTEETWVRSLDIAVENCRRLRDGESLLHQVV
ncbi:MAG: 2-hydroxyacid dehydrogenase [Rhodospirillales bacterium]|nr:2-hydroxyacid dehydrogenase [Rhodospirillales bacterium]